MKIAIVGGGIAGLSALWGIQKYSNHEVELFEKEDRIGGDACTIPFHVPGKRACQIDLAFLLFNTRGWPNICRLFEELGVKTGPATATYSFSGNGGRFEWSSHSLRTVFGSWANMLNLDMWRMIWDICRFNNFALDILADRHRYEHLSVASFVKEYGYSRAFAEGYLIPFLGTMWPTSTSNIANMSMVRATEALHSAGLLQLWSRQPWCCVEGGSSEYVKKIVHKSSNLVHTNTEVHRVTSLGDGEVVLGFADGTTKHFDRVILAIPTDAIRRSLAAGHSLPIELDKVLQQTCWTPAELVAHYDERLMPRDRAHWSGWNATLNAEPLERLEVDSKHNSPADAVSCTFSYNEMLDLPVSAHGHVIVTVNPHIPIDPSKIIHRQHFVQPSACLTAPSAMRRLEDPTWVLNNVPPGVDFAGAWQGLGYHEDGLVSSFKALRRLGVGVPDWKPRVPPIPPTSLQDHAARAAIRVGEGLRRVLSPIFGILVTLYWIALRLWEEKGMKNEVKETGG